MEMSKIIIGSMRLKDRESGVKTVRSAIDKGFNYIDVAPCYRHQSETDNSERWVGEAVNHPGYRDRVMLSAKCTPGNGGLELGDFIPSKGFGVNTSKKLKTVFRQSRERIQTNYFDYYHLWTTHTREQLREAFKPGGWYDGVMEMSKNWGTLGVTSHASPDILREFIDTGKFSALTVPLNVINRTRLEMVDYCGNRGIRVIAMNPLAGGFLANNERLKELALRFLMSLDGVHILIGFSSVEETEYAKWIEETQNSKGMDTDSILREVDDMIDTEEPRCTSCGYCQPCPENINLGACLSYFNAYYYMNIRETKKAFVDKQWEDGLRLDRCKFCGKCKSKCPNSLDTIKIIQKARNVLYS